MPQHQVLHAAIAQTMPCPQIQAFTCCMAIHCPFIMQHVPLALCFLVHALEQHEGTLFKRGLNCAGLYQSTPHRVLNADPTRSRVSIPFFYEPAFDAQVGPVLVAPASLALMQKSSPSVFFACGALKSSLRALAHP